MQNVLLSDVLNTLRKMKLDYTEENFSKFNSWYLKKHGQYRLVIDVENVVTDLAKVLYGLRYELKYEMAFDYADAYSQLLQSFEEFDKDKDIIIRACTINKDFNINDIGAIEDRLPINYRGSLTIDFSDVSKIAVEVKTELEDRYKCKLINYRLDTVEIPYNKFKENVLGTTEDVSLTIEVYKKIQAYIKANPSPVISVVDINKIDINGTFKPSLKDMCILHTMAYLGYTLYGVNPIYDKLSAVFDYMLLDLTAKFNANKDSSKNIKDAGVFDLIKPQSVWLLVKQDIEEIETVIYINSVTDNNILYSKITNLGEDEISISKNQTSLYKSNLLPVTKILTDEDAPVLIPANCCLGYQKMYACLDKLSTPVYKSSIDYNPKVLFKLAEIINKGSIRYR